MTACNIYDIFSTSCSPSNISSFDITPCLISNTTVSTCFELCHYPQAIFSSELSWQYCANATYEDPTIIEVVSTCMSQYCDSPDPSLGGCLADSSSWKTETSLDYLEAFYPDCPVVVTINSDIGGIGVSDICMLTA
jgi:hypothetical protein